jgi:type IV pilus assembly protein PilC
MFADMGGKLPLLTRIMMSASDITRGYWYIVFPALIGLFIGVRKLKATDKGTAFWDRVKLHLPMGIGEITRKMAVARFSRTLGTLVASGVPILQAIEITGRSAGNVVIERAMIGVGAAVKEGETISGPLAKAKVFPEMVVQMLSVGEETGSLDHMLNKVADFYEAEVDASVKSLTSILEPIMMIGVGAIVGTVVISMYLPIFNIMNIIKQ